MRTASLALTAMVLAVGSPARAAFAPPTGIYVLSVAQDNPNTPADERLGQIRNYDFVSGFTLRVFWSDIEPTLGAYNFSVIDEALRLTALAGKRVNLEVLDAPPSYLVTGAAATYIDHRGGQRPVPWDPFAQSRYAALETALANHVVADGTGRNLKLSEHPTLASLDASSVGLNFGVRDLNNGIRSHPDYTQAKYIASVVQGVGTARAAFPNHTGFLAFFGFNDGTPGVPVDQQLIAALAQQYNGPGQPTLAFFIENLSDTGPVPIGSSGGTGNNLLAWVADGGATMAQALDSWQSHQPSRDAQLASLNPSTGMALMNRTYGTRFYELYVTDIDAAYNGALDANGRPLVTGMRYWNTLSLPVVPEASGTALWLAVGATGLQRRRRQ